MVVPLLTEGLTPELEMIAERELGETPLVKKNSLEKLKQLIEKEPDFYPFVADSFLLLFLRCKKHDIQKAFKQLRNYYIFKEKNSRVLSDFLPSELKNLMEMNCYSILPFRDPKNCGVALFRAGQYKWQEASLEDFVATALTLGFVFHKIETISICGWVLIYDLKDFSLEQIFKLVSPKFLTFICSCLQDCLPFRIRGIHIVNEPRLYHVFYNIIKFSLPKKIKERVFFHGSNLEGLHKHFPPEMLPEELGGKTGPFDSAECFNFALTQQPLIEEMNKCGFKKTTSTKSG